MARIPPKHKRREDRRKRLFRLQGGICAGCKQPQDINKMTFDHKFPQSKHEDNRRPQRKKRRRRGKGSGVDGFRNIELLCRPCNAFKADNWPWDWNAYVWDPFTQSLKSRCEIEDAVTHRRVFHKKGKVSQCRTVRLVEGSSDSSSEDSGFSSSFSVSSSVAA